MRVKDKTAIVTGGGMGIGQGICLRLAQEGAKVAVFDIDKRAAGDTVAAIEAQGGMALACEVDVSNRSHVEGAVQDVVAAFGGVDILVNNAAISKPEKVDRMSDETWDRMNDINLKGVFLCCRAVIPSMKEQRYGRIVSITSILAAEGSPYYAHYSATKAGVLGFTRGLAVELGPRNITVNAIGPGVIDTPMSRTDVALETRERLEKRIPLRRIGVPDDIANAVLFLVSEESSYITGQCLYVCGGLSADASLI